MSADEQITLLQTKVERAKHHISDLQALIQRFMGTRPFVIKTKEDPQTNQRVYYVESFTDPGPEFSVLTGDVLHNLRSALDHLAYRLVCVGLNGTPTDPWNIAYPIADSVDAYPALRDRRVEHVREEAKQAIDATTPYRGGNDMLWRLHKLSNIDKHRLLLTVASRPRAVDLGGCTFRKMCEQFPDIAKNFKPDSLSAFFIVADRPFPLQQGYECFREPIDRKPDEHLKLSFDIAIGEPGVMEGEPVIETLQQMANLVDKLISHFKPYLN
jgi:hypothetical protein